MGAALDKLSKAKGKDIAAPFRKRYFAVPFASALRTEALRPDVMEKLRAIDRDIATALRK